MTPGPVFDLRAARELFQTASVWRGAVIGGAVFTALAVVFSPSSPHPTSTYTAPRPAAPPTSPPPAAPVAPVSSNQAPVAPVVPKIQPGAQADLVTEQPVKKDGRFGEAKEDEQPDGHIKPGQPLEN